MKCPRCQQDNPPQARYCMKCSAKVARTCGKCSADLPANAAFCVMCGEPVIADTSIHPRFASPGAYTPKHLAERILTSESALEGERKHVTVLFADIKSSMELLADRDPEEARALLDPALQHMMDAVHHYEGTVNQVIGDGIMALFGWPLAHEDHAVRACYAALRMQDSMKRYAGEVFRSHGITVQIRVGLNSGEVVVRAIDSDLQMDFTAIGQTTHLAARMEQLAVAGTILLTSATLQLAEGYVLVNKRGPVPIKGLAEPAEVYELTGVGPVRSRLHASVARGLTRFVGRQNELDLLDQTLERAFTGHGQIVAVVGEPGVGKSRLCWEFTHSQRIQGWLVLESGSVSSGKANPYLPVINLLKAYFHIDGQDDNRKILEKVTARVLSLDPALEPFLPALLSVLDVLVDDAEWERLDPPQRQQRTLDAVRYLLLRESQQVQPVIVLVEDLHSIDTATQTLLDSLLQSLPFARLLLLVTYRPEYQHGWASKACYRQARIDPLSEESLDDLLTSLLGADQSLDALKRELIERTEGNPLFLEESVRTLVETKSLVGQRGDYRLAQGVHNIRVPETVQAILAARIDRLAPEDKRLLQTASVVGKDVPFALLKAIAGLHEQELRERLARLQAAEFLYELRLFPGLEYSFKHALTREVTQESLLHERRQGLHARIVDAIETLYCGRLVEQTEVLAYHAFNGKKWRKAVTYLQQAGAKAADRSANREAVAFFEQALAALEHLPAARETLTQAIDLRFDLRNSFLAIGDLDRLSRCMQEAETLALTLGDQERLGRLSAYMTNYFFVTGDQDRALEAGERALAIATASGAPSLQVEAVFRLGQVHHALGDYRQAVDVLGRAIASLTGELVHQRFGLPVILSVVARNWLVRSLAELGEFSESVIHGEDGLKVAEAGGQPIDLVVALHGIGVAYLRKGDLHAATAKLERGVDVCRTDGVRLWLPQVASELGLAYALSGRVAEAMPLLEQAVETHSSMKRMEGHSRWITWHAEGCLMAGRLKDAAKLAEHALSLSREHKERGHEAWALRLHGDIAAKLAPGDWESAARHYEQALALATELGMRPLVARCHLGLEHLHRQQGNLSNAAEHFRNASVLLFETGAAFGRNRDAAEASKLC